MRDDDEEKDHVDAMAELLSTQIRRRGEKQRASGLVRLYFTAVMVLAEQCVEQIDEPGGEVRVR